MINYDIINSSIKHYDSLNYKRIESPWMVTEEIDSITRPHDKDPYVVKDLNKNLVASGEQSFIYLMVKGYIPEAQNVSLQTVTPCFRRDVYDFLHVKTFIKNELIIIDPDNTRDRLYKIVDDVISFFKIYIAQEQLKIKKTGLHQFDILYRDVELGSYGYREYKHLKWIYGTGVAEPRFSNVIKSI